MISKGLMTLSQGKIEDSGGCSQEGGAALLASEGCTWDHMLHQESKSFSQVSQINKKSPHKNSKTYLHTLKRKQEKEREQK